MMAGYRCLVWTSGKTDGTKRKIREENIDYGQRQM